ncbi:SDR family NAD(P)-dependent oxidoreductase [Lysobacter arenosi]|uniref:SDR family NAD(P)-dependent oxidoreductase n=1 Tax=Lysobacter arenosi TaxID=2795387 RepID=A0ABX7R8Z7_9GAMM|nr:SDR family NAD(P)-dependent oxidoreductase [Lysobacter arenosi]QSX73877.1 SDR family NAD(P)-dependent oxidoreductase [Lysobacter arenosi]
MSKVWLITGSASGLGRAIAEHVLEQGDRLVATARRPEVVAELRDKYAGRVALAALDVTDPAQAEIAVEVALREFGRLDVLVNNAGFARVGPFEQMPPADFNAQIDANFYGVVNLVRAAIPTMRQQQSGHIINISSGAGRLGAPGMAAYHAAKWAVGGFTESIAKELRGFGVHTVAVEPGSMPTRWAASAGTATPVLLPEYEPSVGRVIGILQTLAGHEIGDLAKYAKAMFNLSRADELPNHLILGSDALSAIRAAEHARDEAARAWEEVTLSTDRAGANLDFLANLPPH